MITHQTLRRLVYFAAIADAGSIRGAAMRLGLSVPVLSEALSDLEAELGVSLATRSTRRFELSDTGVQVHAVAQQIVAIAGGLTNLGDTDQPLSGVLRLTIPVELADFWLPERILQFQRRHPGVRFDIDVSDQVVDLRASPIEIAIRTHYAPPTGRVAMPSQIPLVLVARADVQVGVQGDISAALIDSRAERRLVPVSRLDQTPLALDFAQTHRVTNRAAALQLARAGVGAVIVMRASVEAELTRGDLIELMPDHDFGAIEAQARFRDALPGPAARSFVAALNLSGS